MPLIRNLSIVLLAALAGAAAGVRPLPLNVSAPGCARAAAYASHTQYGAVLFDVAEGTYVFQSDASIPDAVAHGSYLDASHTVSNFGQLRISTSGSYNDNVQVFAGGFLEGYMTAPRIAQNHKNLHSYFVNVMNASLDEPMAWIRKQDRWVRERCAEDRGIPAPPGAPADAELEDAKEAAEAAAAAAAGNENENENRRHRWHRRKRHRRKHQTDDDFEGRVWDAACLAIRQFDGLVAGYAARATAEAAEGAAGTPLHLPELKYDNFLFLESNADLYDLIDWMDPSQRPSWNPGGDAPTNAGSTAPADPTDADAERLFRKLALSGKCSALVTVAADLSDLFLGHSTWDSFTAMLRMYKHYQFNLTELRPAANALSFSSYPGEIFSDDDFYVLSSGLVVLQTTNKIFNDDLFDLLDPHTLLSWQRVRAAHHVASSGEEWTAALATANSGTYNNQYMVLDLKFFTPGRDLSPGTLWVAEQIPGQVVARDMTATLALLGYWPSYNVPAFEEIYNASGYPDFISQLSKYGQQFSKSTHWLSYETSPRASIFRRDHASVDSLESMKALMRSNDYKNDPLSEGHPICAVCGRGDLDTGFPEARGCYDAKVTSWSMAKEMGAEAINGPTTGGGGGSGMRGGGQLPVFTWEAAQRAVGQDLVHEGQPERFNFEFERMAPEDGAAAVCGDGGGGGGVLATARRL